MVPPSSIAVAADGERLACGGFSLGKTVHLGNFEFIADYFGGLSVSPRRGNKGVTFVGLTHYGASTPQHATIEDSTEEFLIASSGEGSFSHPSPRRRSTWASLTPATTTTWKENALPTMIFPLVWWCCDWKPTSPSNGATLIMKDSRCKPMLAPPPRQDGVSATAKQARRRADHCRGSAVRATLA
jgi:hypothetical protein